MVPPEQQSVYAPTRRRTVRRRADGALPLRSPLEDGVALTLLTTPCAPDTDQCHARALAEHARSVASLARSVCGVLGLASGEARLVERAALMHDLGKLAVPRAILDKPAELDADEWALVRRHPVIGEAVVRALGAHPEIAPLVRHHHERWDGAGYPDGLAGERIPLGARIIAACDTFDAITSPRPYCEARGTWAALAEITSVAGRQLDPDVVAALVVAVGHP
jgi:putative nucleotidyltransferase with HDIG domain